MTGLEPGLKFYRRNQELVQDRQRRMEEFLEAYAADPEAGKTAALAKVNDGAGLSYKRYRQWREQHPQFRARVDRIDELAGKSKRNQTKTARGFEGGFAAFRKKYFGHDTPWHQRHVVDAYDEAQIGDVILVLMPPEHGKTTLTEDDFTYRLSIDPTYLITSVSNGQAMARKMSRRVKNRFETNRELIADFGPFAPQTGEKRTKKAAQPWGEDFWDVFLKGDHDERDYSFATGGWKSNIAGTRTKRLHLDDIQAKNSANLSKPMFELFQQDMLSRPARTGFTSVAGTRVAEDDFYQLMMDEFEGEPWFKKIVYPAIVIDELTSEPVPLWPFDPVTEQGYTMEFLAATRKRVGEDAWWRNFMQAPRRTGMAYFDADKLAECCDPLRRIDHGPADLGMGFNRTCTITLDPALGSRNTFLAMHLAPDRLMVLDGQIDVGLQRNEQIFDKLKLLLDRLIARGWNPDNLIIEAMNFQRGLARDDRLLKIQDDYGLTVTEHLTGDNKYDENIGVPSMAGDVSKLLLSFPTGDEASKYLTELIIGECRSWKPAVNPQTGRLVVARGNRLRQDLVMALWFGWIRWQQLRPTLDQGASPINVGGLPWRSTMRGLLVPGRK